MTVGVLDPSPHRSTWTSALTTADATAALEASTDLRDIPFALTWKLSGAGIVGRVLDLPATERTFVGRATPTGFELVLSPTGSDRHAFEPIAEVRVREAGSNAEVDILLRLHKEHRSMALPFALMGAACLVAGAAATRQDPATGLMAMVLGAAFVGLPPARSRSLFGIASRRTRDALVALLQLRPQ